MRNAAAGIREYHHRALEIRTIAAGIVDADCRRSLLRMAEDYERRAKVLEEWRATGSLVDRPPYGRQTLN